MFSRVFKIYFLKYTRDSQFKNFIFIYIFLEYRKHKRSFIKINKAWEISIWFMNEEKLKFSFLKRTRGVISSVMLIHAYSLCLFFLNLFFNNHMESFFFISFFFVSPRFYIASVIPPPTRATKAVCNGNSRHGVKKERAGGLREKKWGRVNKN